ncbi:hypothetical protein JI664_21460 [Rhodobacter sp. NTK016B]|uniref:hypothetical protein n=1 Tax=Rhodobacter sp. NTK016B TaxID=2759676 RepID=UPI001A8D857C|nr:hypothetical protein [Rhodobacter sp. NTK016B]MBN8294555.1 hypothetical protein [Rhodobacter sp. NTK016B]
MPPEADDHLTDEEREALADVDPEEQAALDLPDEPDGDDEPWHDEERERLKGHLTDDELKALAEDYEDAGHVLSDEEANDQPGDANDDDDDANGAADDDPAQQPAADHDDAQRAPAVPEQRHEAEPAKVPELTDEERAAIRGDTREKIKALRQEYDDGERTEEELDSAIADAFDAEKAAFDEAINAKLQEAAEQAHAARQAEFSKDVTAFQEKNPDLFAPGTIEAYDAFVRAVSSAPGAEKLSNQQILERSRDAYHASIGKAPTPKTPSPAPKQQDRGNGGKPKPTQRNLPPTLNHIPAAEPNDVRGDSLAAMARRIDAADPLEAERLMATLTEDQRDRLMELQV